MDENVAGLDHIESYQVLLRCFFAHFARTSNNSKANVLNVNIAINSLEIIYVK